MDFTNFQTVFSKIGFGLNWLNRIRIHGKILPPLDARVAVSWPDNYANLSTR